MTPESIQTLQRYIAKLKLSGISLEVRYGLDEEYPELQSLAILDDLQPFRLNHQLINNGKFIIDKFQLTEGSETDFLSSYTESIDRISKYIDFSQLDYAIQLLSTVEKLMCHKNTLFINTLTNDQIYKVEIHLRRELSAETDAIYSTNKINLGRMYGLLAFTIKFIRAKKFKFYYEIHNRYINPQSPDQLPPEVYVQMIQDKVYSHMNPQAGIITNLMITEALNTKMYKVFDEFKFNCIGLLKSMHERPQEIPLGKLANDFYVPNYTQSEKNLIRRNILILDSVRTISRQYDKTGRIDWNTLNQLHIK